MAAELYLFCRATSSCQVGSQGEREWWRTLGQLLGGHSVAYPGRRPLFNGQFRAVNLNVARG